MTDLRDFLNWFDGFAENIDKMPNQKQWDKIKQRVTALRTAGLDSPDDHLSSVKKTLSLVKPATVAAPAKPTYPFYIDADGMARNKKGDRILPKDVSDIIYDLRGIDGDTKTITWADGSQGVRELNASIAAA